MPGFVRAAQRKAFWHSPGMRALLLLVGGLLLAALAGQWALHERHYLAAREPQLRPYLQQACEVLQCQVGRYQNIAAVAIESSGFNKSARGEGYQLSLSLRNQASLPVAMPAVELTLTDTQEQVVLRRVLLPEELSAPAVLAAEADWNGSIPITLSGAALRLAGYSVIAFYPD